MEVTAHTNGCSEGEGLVPGKRSDICRRDEFHVDDRAEGIWAVGMRLGRRQRISVGLERSK